MTYVRQDSRLAKIHDIIQKNKQKRMVFVGTTCIGKSTMINGIPNAVDLDELLFPLLSEDEKRYVIQTPWKELIGDKMTALAKQHLSVEKRKPLFGTIVLDCDLVIFLKATKEKLKRRTKKRGVDIQDTLNMQQYIERKVISSGIKSITIEID